VRSIPVGHFVVAVEIFEHVDVSCRALSKQRLRSRSALSRSSNRSAALALIDNAPPVAADDGGTSPSPRYQPLVSAVRVRWMTQ
jgi:hypothetical protein